MTKFQRIIAAKSQTINGEIGVTVTVYAKGKQTDINLVFNTEQNVEDLLNAVATTMVDYRRKREKQDAEWKVISDARTKRMRSEAAKKAWATRKAQAA